MVIIPFLGPGIQAHTAEQQRAFSDLKSLKAEAANSIGYIVALGKHYRQNGAFQVDEYEKQVAGLTTTLWRKNSKGIFKSYMVHRAGMHVAQILQCTLLLVCTYAGCIQIVGRDKASVWEYV